MSEPVELRYNDPMVDQWLQLEQQPYTEADAEWDAFVANHPHGSLLQTTYWAQLKNRFGWRSHRVWLKKDGELVAGAQVLYRSLALGAIRIGYVPHGPLVDWGDEEQVSVLLNQLDHAAYEHRAGLLKMEPYLWEEEIGKENWAALCARLDCETDTDTIQPPRTILVDLTRSEEEILAAMKQKTRYNIRLSARKNVTVRHGTIGNIKTFNQLIQITAQRDNFGIHDPNYYRAAYEVFAPDHVALLLADYQKKPLAGVMSFAYGAQGAYLYGASSNEERQRMPTYAVQWAAMQWAKEKGCTFYDLWGVPDVGEEELEANFMAHQEGLWSVYRFKRGFGGQVRRTVGIIKCCIDCIAGDVGNKDENRRCRIETPPILPFIRVPAGPLPGSMAIDTGHICPGPCPAKLGLGCI